MLFFHVPHQVKGVFQTDWSLQTPKIIKIMKKLKTTMTYPYLFSCQEVPGIEFCISPDPFLVSLTVAVAMARWDIGVSNLFFSDE